ncbi:MAG: TldD/PmbA family protein [Clostridiales bacterium]|jgi:TldD protein|nr:TldD/PmbA family protein [Clostridiales bacterium]
MAYQWKAELDRLLAQGAAYADVRYHPREEHSTLMIWNGNMHAFARDAESGFGVRVLYDGAWGFAAASDLSNIPAVFDRALENARVAARRVGRPIRLADKEVVSGQFVSPCTEDPLLTPLSTQVDFLMQLDKRLDVPSVEQRLVYIDAASKTVAYYDTQGAHIEKTIREIFPGMQVRATGASGDMQRRSWQPPRLGDTRGWEVMDQALWESEADRITDELRQLKEAPACPDGLRSVILLPDMMYLQVHETIGHALELDRILGYELSYAGGSFVRLEDFGVLRYGSPKLNARADATLPNSPGSFGYDDDGVPAKNTMLIENGILVGAITSRQMVTEANERAGRTIFPASGGTARASSFWRAPLERMTNINIDPGTDGSLDDIIAATEKGVVLSGDKSWSIGSNREQFHFATEIGWLVEDGQKKGIVNNCAYSGQTLPFYRSLSMVGDESTWQVQYVDNCGKGAPSQVMQLGHGIPVCRFDNVKVGA